MSQTTDQTIIAMIREEGYDHFADYAEKYGLDKSVPPYFWKGKKDWPNIDRLLRRCLKEGKRWEEVNPTKPGELY